MQCKPSEPTHKLLCWQNQREEDIMLCGVDTHAQKKRTARWRDI